jgi:hypothetical protein
MGEERRRKRNMHHVRAASYSNECEGTSDEPASSLMSESTTWLSLEARSIGGRVTSSGCRGSPTSSAPPRCDSAASDWPRGMRSGREIPPPPPSAAPRSRCPAPP